MSTVTWRCACGANLYINEYGHPASRAALRYEKPQQAEPVLQALQTLVFVCQRMDLEHQAERPSEAEYQAAIKAAQEAIADLEGAA